MSVLIKGMKMPKSCSSCGFMYGGCGDGYYCSLLKKTFDIWNEISVKRAKGCPLVEVKEPHDRLGDLDELKSKFCHSEGDNDVDSAWISTIRRAITQAETIVAAEGIEE